MNGNYLLINVFVVMALLLLPANIALAETVTSLDIENSANDVAEDDESSENEYGTLGTGQGTIFTGRDVYDEDGTIKLRGIVINDATFFVDKDTVLQNLQGEIVEIQYFNDFMPVEFNLDDDSILTRLQHIEELPRGFGGPDDEEDAETTGASAGSAAPARSEGKKETIRQEGGVWKN